MKTALLTYILGLFLAAPALGQNPSATPQSSSPAPQSPAPSQAAQPQQANQLPAGVVIPAELSKSVDAKKAKSGDKVEAKTTMDLLSHGQIVVPRNTKIIGRVTEAKPHSKESPDSMVGMVFDRMAMKDGRELQMQAAVQAIGRPLQSAALSGGGSAPVAGGGMGAPPAGAPGGQGSGNASGGRSDTMGSNSPSSYPAGTPSGPAGDTGGPNAAASALDPHSQGVVGIEGLSLRSSNEGSVVSSNDQNVHLDGGTQLILKTQ